MNQLAPASAIPEILWRPSQARIERSGLHRFFQWLEHEKGLRFADYQAAWEWSTQNVEPFWEAVWQFFDVQPSQPYTRVLVDHAMPGAKWFPGVRLNIARHVFRHAATDRPAIVFASELVPLTEISWQTLEHEVASVAQALREMGIEPGDRVAGFVPNIPQAMVAFLACASIGAIWSGCAPDMGAASVLDRFRQIEPKVLFAVDGYRYGGKDFDRRNVVAELQRGLPTLRHLVLVPYLDRNADANAFGSGMTWHSLLGRATEIAYAEVEGDHPLWIVYSSGTSGPPKAIVHGHAGILITTLRSVAWEFETSAEDRFFWYTSTSWIMWNKLVLAGLVGATVVLYDGNPGYPDPGTLWRFCGEAKVSVLGTSPAFIAACMKAGTEPDKVADLSAVHTLGASGSPLSDDAYRWIYRHIGQDVLLASGSGGTDIAGGFVGPCALLPLYAGEMQCRQLGVAVHAFDEHGKAVINQVGEMVITEPMPSMPLYFWGDDCGTRYRESYFDMYPGMWRQGDWMMITDRGTALVYGRSDATINRHGLRLGSADLYRAVERVDEVLDSLIVDLEYLGRPSWMGLFVTLRMGIKLDDALRAKINDAIRTTVSARFIPDEIQVVDAIPRTLTGKKMELPVKKLLLGMPAEKVASRDAMANPEALDWFVAFAGRFGQGRGGA